MIDFGKIKLLIWDLDETFWQGILSDHTAIFNEANAQLVRDMADAGVICSICSNNNERQVLNFLQEHGIADLFVFCSINWAPKGARVKQIISEMNLRANNVLFVDDNPVNLGEALEFCSELMVSDEKIIPLLRKYYSHIPKSDVVHSRLAQYRLMEEKKRFSATEESNESFLKKCNIRVSIKCDCLKHIDRISELVMRSNQLNFTKVRSSTDELRSLLQKDTIKAGYVEVKDVFGDYGIVGFFAIEQNVLCHFVFSCRILNMGVEQYVYHKLGKPKLFVVGDVSSALDSSCPDWINCNCGEEDHVKMTVIAGNKIVFKGPCDMQQMFSFIRETGNIITEFTYVNNRGVQIEQGNHTTHIVESLQLSKEEKRKLAKALPFGDTGMFYTKMFDADVGAVVLSMLSDPNLGLYQKKDTGAVIAFGEYIIDLTDETNWEDILSGKVYTANCRFKESDLRDFRQKYVFLGRIHPEEIIENLNTIYSNLNADTILILCLGSEVPFQGNIQKAYVDRHIDHQILNQMIRKWAVIHDHVYLLDVNQYIHGQEDYTNNINHYKKHVYYHMCEELIAIMNSESGQILQFATEQEKKRDAFLRKTKKIPNKIIRKLRGAK